MLDEPSKRASLNYLRVLVEDKMQRTYAAFSQPRPKAIESELVRLEMCKRYIMEELEEMAHALG